MTRTNLIAIAFVLAVFVAVISDVSAIPTKGDSLVSLVRQNADNETETLPTVTDTNKPENATESETAEKPKNETTGAPDTDNKEEAKKEEEDKKESEMGGVAANNSTGNASNATVDGNSTGNGTNSTTTNSTDPVCFPATALVTLVSGEQKRMMELVVGDRVAVGGGKFSEVFMFTHRLADVTYYFVELSTAHGKLRATDGHYVYANGKYIAAGSVKVGDTLELADGRKTAVTSIKSVKDFGLYNPQTAHGDIIVSGIRASTYTTAVHHNMAQALLLPVRAVFARFGLSFTLLEKGSDVLANAVPGGALIA